MDRDQGQDSEMSYEAKDDDVYDDENKIFVSFLKTQNIFFLDCNPIFRLNLRYHSIE
jgi:hypothetical protein